MPINDNLEAMAKQLYDYWFVQFDFPNEEGKPYKSSGGAMVWNEKLKREIPKDGMLPMYLTNYQFNTAFHFLRNYSQKSQQAFQLYVFVIYWRIVFLHIQKRKLTKSINYRSKIYW